MEVEIGNILSMLIEISATVLLAVGSVVAKKAGDFIGGSAGDKMEKHLDKLIAEGVSYAKKQAKKRSKETSVSPHAMILRQAIEFVNENGPETIRKLGYKPDQLQKRIESWL